MESFNTHIDLTGPSLLCTDSQKVGAYREMFQETEFHIYYVFRHYLSLRTENKQRKQKLILINFLQ